MCSCTANLLPNLIVLNFRSKQALNTTASAVSLCSRLRSPNRSQSKIVHLCASNAPGWEALLSQRYFSPTSYMKFDDRRQWNMFSSQWTLTLFKFTLARWLIGVLSTGRWAGPANYIWSLKIAPQPLGNQWCPISFSSFLVAFLSVSSLCCMSILLVFIIIKNIPISKIFKDILRI